jgi:carnitine O-acetyltransferase
LVLQFDEFGKNFPKSQKISPDAFVQLAMQLAFYKTHRLLGNAYESGALRQFHLGRTEIIRACSSEAADFVRAMLASYATQSEKAVLLSKALATHAQLTRDALSFDSFDRHLFGLKQIALENRVQLPSLYESVAFRRATHFYISSSQISSRYEEVTTYGPLVEDGYGCAYNIMETKLLFGISALNSCAGTSAKLYAENLRSSLLDCQKLLLKVNSKL